ncbi:hypothetical protein ACFSTA_08995 [Ornithinibacillus salinisoli]|uniref:Asparagine synthetase domain-containing protein n=1 Tax=Ornithinibacillus salinisoli TaxID=1848459 RepID=A0ABW4W0E0_9BACI
MNSSLMRYRFGFAIYKNTSRPNLEEIKDWDKFEANGYHIHTHPEVNVQTVETSHGTAILIGEAFVCKGRKKLTDIMKVLLRKDDWEVFDCISGRFALFLINASQVKILHDPFGSRTIYYLQNKDVCVASHSALVASLFKEKFSEEAKRFIKLPEYKMRGTGYLPGDVTMYDNIKALVPNNYYDMNEKRTVRYWPRNPIKSVSTRFFLKQCDRYLSNFTKYYSPKYNLLLGLTGGVDTRALVAGIMGQGVKLRLITWTGNRLPEKEVPIVAKMKEHLGCPHVYLDPSNKVDSERFTELRKEASTSTGYSRGFSGLTAHMGEVVQPNEIFVRGFGGEIIRGFYSRHKASMSGDLIKDFMNLYKTKRIKEPGEEFTNFVAESTKGFIERANYSNEMFNIDVSDLFYWEQRMGMWGSNMLNEMDPAIYSVVGFNSRPLYETAFGLDEKERLGAEIMLKITARYDKKFSEIGVLS